MCVEELGGHGNQQGSFRGQDKEEKAGRWRWEGERVRSSKASVLSPPLQGPVQRALS